MSDEVFADFELTRGARAASGQLIARTDVLGFTLGGLSKSIGLPQVKLAWIAISGPDAVVKDARARLELVCDTYLSVSTPLQAAAAELLERGAAVRDQICRRISANYARSGPRPRTCLHARCWAPTAAGTRSCGCRR